MSTQQGILGGERRASVMEKSHKIVGRDEDKKQIIELLMQSSSQENLPWPMGGKLF